MNTWTECDIRYSDHRARVARGERVRLLREGPTRDGGRPTVRATPALDRCQQERVDTLLTGARRPFGGAYGVVRLAAAALGRRAALAHDGRDGLRGKERDVAAPGVRWGRG